MTQKKQHIVQLEKALKAVKDKNAKQYYFVACGGSMATLQSAQYIFDRETAVPSYTYTSKEFICRNPKALGENSIVILCSHSGTTPETVQAASFAREKGALTLAFSNDTESPLCEAAEYVIHYDWGTDAVDSDGLNEMLFRLAFGILNTINQCERYERSILAVDILHNCINANKEKFTQAALTFAQEFRRESTIYTMASGGYYSEAYATTSCLLMEMQWINSGCIHSAEYFHGPFEITDYDVPFILLKGTGDTRIMDERAHDFLKKYSKRLVVIDAEDFIMDGIDEDLRAYLSQAIMTEVVRLYIDSLAAARGHLMTVRRYMWKMKY